MLVSSDGQIQNDEDYDSVDRDGVTAYWTGFVYISGYRAGRDSVERMLDIYAEQGRVPFESLRGAYNVIVAHEDNVLVFADASDMHTIFLHEEAVSTKFLQLLAHVRATGTGAKLSLSPEAVAQAYAFGRIVSDKTIIDEVVLLDKFDYVEVRGTEIVIRSKGVPDIDRETMPLDPRVFFDDLATAIGDDIASCALTGGYDSRMVYAFLQNRVDVTPSLSGDRTTISDAVVAKKVLNQVASELNFIKTDKPEISNESVLGAFTEQDGTAGFLRDSSLRLSSFYTQLAEQQVSMHVTGDGGVLYKDWEWIQDFPFYHRKRTNLGRFYNDRLSYDADRRGAGHFIATSIGSMKPVLLGELRKHLRDTNSQSYDMLYYRVNGRRSTHYNNAIRGVNIYAPLLEREMVAFSYSLPRRKRFFNGIIRQLTSSQNAAIARVPTVYGTTASDGRLYVIRDVGFQLKDYLLRFSRMVGRRVLGRTPMLESVVEWNTDSELRALPLAEEAVRFCIDRQIVDASETRDSMSRRHLECAIQVLLTCRAAGIG